MDWGDGGLTNIDDLTLACKPHNLLVKPPHRPRVNHYHHPDKYLLPENGDDD
jgi:hypothetical protein